MKTGATIGEFDCNTIFKICFLRVKHRYSDALLDCVLKLHFTKSAEEVVAEKRETGPVGEHDYAKVLVHSDQILARLQISNFCKYRIVY